VRAPLRSKGHLLTPALKEIGQTRTKRLLQLPSKKGHENFLFTDEKIFTSKEQYKNQYKIYAQMSLDIHAESTGGHDPSYVMIWLGVVPLRGGHTSSFL
jgi:hypothetical protein